MRGLWPLLIPTFVAGFGAAWWLKPVPSPAITEIERPKVLPRIPGKASDLRETVLTRPTLLDALADLDSKAEIDRQLQAIEPAEIPALLDEMALRVGYFGLDHRDQSTLSRLLVRWYAHDPDAALLWTLAQVTPDDRRRLLSALIDAEAERDFARALKLASHYRTDPGGEIILTDLLVEKAAESGADALVGLCRASRTRGGDETFGRTLDYPDDFDFPAALDGLADLVDALEAGERLTEVPGNLLEEWARRDPRAAYAWLERGRKVPMNDGFVDFVRGYARVAGPAELGAFAAEVFAAAPPGGHGDGRVFEILTEVPAVAVLEGYLGTATDPAMRDERLGRLFEHAAAGDGGKVTKARELILRTLSPERRIDLLAGSRLSKDQRAELLPVLRSLGHREEEITPLLDSPR